MRHQLMLFGFYAGLLSAMTLGSMTYAQSLQQDDTGGLQIDGVLITTGQKLSHGAVSDPWTPATDLATFSKIARQRPAGVQADPILCWMADLYQRDGQSVSMDSLDRQRTLFKEQHGFYIREDDTGLWIANTKIGLRLDTSGGTYTLVSFYDLAHRIELIGRKPEQGSLFRIQVLRYREDGTTGVLNFGPQMKKDSPDLSMLVEVDAQQSRSINHALQVNSDQLVLAIAYQDVSVPDSPGSLNVTVTLRLKPNDSLTYWRSQVSGDLARAGIAKVRSPVMTHFGYDNENDVCYAWGSQRGVMKRASRGVTQGTYPSSQWALQYFSLSFGPRTTLYAAAHDPNANVKSFHVQPGRLLYFSADVPNTGVLGNADYQQPYDVAVGPIEGNWFDSAQRYRQWATHHTPWAKTLLIDRKDVSHRMLKVAYWIRCNWMDDDGSDGDASWAFDQSMFKIPARETVDWYLRTLAIPPQRLGAIHYGWQEQVWDTRLPYWTAPGPQFAEELQRETAMGMSTYIYTNPCWFDPATDGFNDSVKKDIVRNIDGSMYFEKYNAKMYMLNFGSETFSRVIIDLAEYAQGAGANGIYYDQFSGIIRGGDYDPDKGSASLGRGGNIPSMAKIQALQKLRQKMGAGFGLVSEFYTEPSQHLFDVQSVTIHADPMEVPLIPAIYSGYVVQHGAGLDRQTRPVSSTVSLGRNFLWGTSLGWTQFATELRRSYTRLLLKQIVQLRIQMDDFLVYGQMIQPPKYATKVPRIDLDAWYVSGTKRPIKTIAAYETTMWQSQDGQRAMIMMNYDKKRHLIEFLKNNLDKKGLLGNLTLLEPSQGAEISVVDDRFVVNIPPNTAAVVLLP